ncbi:hypothetical protein Ocin01_13150 [Orchesella cincta]|uniref:Secreted protein n=1 Tax=Orchesella cincta TaxID=48709 RepID=A0A1D2MKX6_ORCCI|nr:hypothetical protein Ocin01_13150 [Orchesella cincta]
MMVVAALLAIVGLFSCVYRHPSSPYQFGGFSPKVTLWQTRPTSSTKSCCLNRGASPTGHRKITSFIKNMQPFSRSWATSSDILNCSKPECSL